MISSNTRATRSRYSSPAQQPQQNGRSGSADGSGPLEPSRRSANEGSRTLMEKWLEPSVQNKTSYEEAGLMRYGVLENMAPLGTMPKPKKTGQGQENGTLTVRRIILRQSLKGAANAANAANAASTARDSPPAPRSPSATGAGGPRLDSAATTSTPEPPLTSQPAPAPHNTSSLRLTTRRSLATRDTTAQEANDGDDDEDYDPRKSAAARRKPMGRPSLPKRGRPPSSARRGSMASVKTSPVKHRSTTPPPPESHGPDFAEKVIEAAVDEALHHYRYPTAYALRTLYDEKAGDAAFVSMIEEVFSQTADARTLEEFSRQLEKKKREGKRDNQGRDYFVPPSDDGRVTPHKPKPAPYARLIIHHRNGHGGGDDTRDDSRDDGKDDGERRAIKKLKLSHRNSEKTPRKMAEAGAGSSVRTPSTRKRRRRASGASDSSLSSELSSPDSPELPEGSDLGTGAGNENLASPSLRGAAKAKARARATGRAATGRASTRAGATTTGLTGPQSPSQSAPRPITTRRKSLASTKQQQQQAVSNASNASNPSGSNSPTTLLPLGSPTQPNNTASAAGDDATMPGRLAVPAAEQISIRDKLAASAAKGRPKAPMPGPDNGLDGLGDAWEKRRQAQRVTNGYTATESSIRYGDEGGEATPVRTTRKTRQSAGVPPPSARATRSANKRFPDDSDRFESPGLFSVLGDGSSVIGSRAATPTTSLRPAKKQKTGLRVKSSPVKKKGGTAAGVPRSVSEAQSSAAAKDQIADNDEYCSACGNAGDVVCCDGCPRSFHFECVDMVQSENLPDEWYCNECLVRRYPSRVPVHRGVFGGPLNLLEKTIPRAFSLPKRVQNRFEGVRAGADGDYEEVSAAKVTTRKRNGYEESPDFFKQREDGEAVLCHDCLKAATDIRPIISCSACPLHWHIDCLDPPLAVPPVLKNWKCPAHADELLQEAPPLAPAHRYRKLRNAPAITPAISRGLRNNGHIEIDWSSETDDDDKSGWRDIASFGRTYKVPAKGVRLDFIEQLRTHGAGFAPPRDEPRSVEPYLTPPVEDMAKPTPAATVNDRNVEEMQASLILTSLRTAPTDGLEQLTSALLASADPNVISLIAQGDADNIARDHLADQDKVSLRALLAQLETMSGRIRGALGDEALLELPPTLGRQGPPSTIADSKGSVDKMDSEPLVTEPTPPSTIDHEGAMEFDY